MVRRSPRILLLTYKEFEVLKDCEKCFGKSWVWSDKEEQEVPCKECDCSGVASKNRPPVTNL